MNTPIPPTPTSADTVGSLRRLPHWNVEELQARRRTTAIDRIRLAEGAQAVQMKGYAILRHALQEAYISAHIQRIRSADWQPLAAVDGPVEQCAEEYALHSGDPLAKILLKDFALAFDIRESWIPELTYMRYPFLRGHISPHRDHRRYQRVIGTATLTGTSIFSIYTDNSRTEVLESWTVTPGDIVLMAGMESGVADRRPMHAVGHPSEGDRISLTLRYIEAQGHRRRR